MLTAQIAPEKLEEVSRKFGKLMERAKATDSVGEAENCVALAQRLLWESNLDEDQLLSLNEIEKRTKPTFIKDGVVVGPDKYAVNYQFNSRDWKSELLAVLAQNFFCKLHEGYAEVVTIVGEPKSIQIVKGLYEYLEKQIRASRRAAYNLAVEENRIPYAKPNSRSYYKSGYKPTLSQFAVHSFKNSFAKGAVASIGRRLAEQQRDNIEMANANHAPKVDENQKAIGYGAALVAQIYSDLDEAFYEFFPDLHPAAIKLREYQRQIEYTKRMEQLEAERVAREERIAAGLEMAPEPVVYKEYKRRGRRRLYRDTMNGSAYRQGKAAGDSIQINPAISGSKTALNK
jgi:hypothetical protein